MDTIHTDLAGKVSQLAEALHGGLIVSCQPVRGGPLDRAGHVVAMAKAALKSGAAGVRIEGVRNVEAVHAAGCAPLIGIVKRDLPESAVRITPGRSEIDRLAKAGADIIAFDATERPRSESPACLLAAIQARGCAAMADCAHFAEGVQMAESGCAFIASTLSGYTAGPCPETPDLELVEAWVARGYRVIAEGRYHTPEWAAAAIRTGAHAVTVGSAITRLEWITGRFVSAVNRAHEQKDVNG